MQDQILAGDKWTFDGDVTTVFDDMLARSIPQYDVMRKAVFDIGAAYVQPDSAIVDLGASRGEAIAPYAAAFPDNPILAVETSAPMLDVLRSRYGTAALDFDLRRGYPTVSASVTLSVLTLQFIPIEYRQRVVRDVYKSTVPGGAFILVEKVLGACSELDALMVKHYYALKGANGYTPEQIERKRLSLEGVLVPVTAHWNEQLLRMAGFTQIDCFWRWMNFAAWVAVRE